jgi:hypothetical protein
MIYQAFLYPGSSQDFLNQASKEFPKDTVSNAMRNYFTKWITQTNQRPEIELAGNNNYGPYLALEHAIASLSEKIEQTSLLIIAHDGFLSVTQEMKPSNNRYVWLLSIFLAYPDGTIVDLHQAYSTREKAIEALQDRIQLSRDSFSGDILDQGRITYNDPDHYSWIKTEGVYSEIKLTVDSLKLDLYANH